MNRRRFLQALFAVPCLGAPLLVPLAWEPPAFVYRTIRYGAVMRVSPDAWQELSAVARPYRLHFEIHSKARGARAYTNYLWAKAGYPALLGEGG